MWSEAELAAAFGAAPSAPMSEAAGGVSIDSRTLQPGDLFFAIEGETHDGHDHVARAFDFGAAAAVIATQPGGCCASSASCSPGESGNREAVWPSLPMPSNT